jgi:hypothetical protein
VEAIQTFLASGHDTVLVERKGIKAMNLYKSLWLTIDRHGYRRVVRARRVGNEVYLQRVKEGR